MAVKGSFYERAMVVRLAQIFDHPKKPVRFQQWQFDRNQPALERTARKEWHEIDESDYQHYLLDLCYVELDQKLFDHLFPAFLIRWWEGQLDRTGGPESESTFYRAIYRGDVLTKMMDEKRRAEVRSWMADAYLDGVDAWGGHLSVLYDFDGPDDLHGPLSTFHALGQSVPITGPILDELTDVSTLGRAQWWLVLATGLVWNENETPYVPPWTSLGGGGGVYVNMSDAALYDHAYLEENHRALSTRLGYELLLTSMISGAAILESSPQKDWAAHVLDELRASPERIALRTERFVALLARPDLGVWLENPLDTPS